MTDVSEDRLRSPVHKAAPLLPEEAPRDPEDGIALCLSGGGYRAMLYHLGALYRLNDAGLLGKIARFSSVSGGSITASVLAANWSALSFSDGVATNFARQVAEPIRRLASQTIDVSCVLKGVLLPGSVADRIAGAYKEHLGFSNKTLQDLPDEPRFVFNATNIQTSSLWRFSKPYMGDWAVGLVYEPRTELATAVAASSAFPPVLAPVVLKLAKGAVTPVPGCTLDRPPYKTEVVLADGGIYDNLGLETAWKRYGTILVSDAGMGMDPEPQPKRDWLRLTARVVALLDRQVRSLRKRQVIDSYESRERKGAYWGIETQVAKYPVQTQLPCPEDHVLELACTATRLARLEPVYQERLINWGYASCDASLRSHYADGLPDAAFPYPGSGV